MSIDKQLFEPAQRLIAYFGSQKATEEALGVSQVTVSSWLNKKHGINYINAMRAERLTDGTVKAVELCPALKELEICNDE